MEMQLLPIGSVITLNEAKKKLMVIGILVTEEESGKIYDYLGIPYPEGFIDNETMFLFMHRDIMSIDFLGFINAEYQGFRAKLCKELEDRKIIRAE